MATPSPLRDFPITHLTSGARVWYGVPAVQHAETIPLTEQEPRVLYLIDFPQLVGRVL